MLLNYGQLDQQAKHTLSVSQGLIQIDIDQQDYLGVLLGDPMGFGSSVGSQALQAAPASTGISKLRFH